MRGGNLKGAEAVGKAIAERSIEKGIKRVVFDRSGFLYHGRIRAVADAARKADWSSRTHANTRANRRRAQLDIKDTVVSINRVTKVVKGGKNLSFSALVVVGDGHGVVGFGIGKAKEVPSAIKKGIEAAKKNLIRVPLQGTTIPHPIVGNFGAGSVLLKPAPDGTGIIAGGAVRAVVEAAGITNILTKSLGSANPHNVVRATIAGLDSLKDPAAIARMRGKELAELTRASA